MRTRCSIKGLPLMSGVPSDCIPNQVLAQAPNWAEAWNQRATLRYLQRRHLDALDDVERTLALNPIHFGALR